MVFFLNIIRVILKTKCQGCFKAYSSFNDVNLLPFSHVFMDNFPHLWVILELHT